MERRFPSVNRHLEAEKIPKEGIAGRWHSAVSSVQPHGLDPHPTERQDTSHIRGQAMLLEAQVTTGWSTL